MLSDLLYRLRAILRRRTVEDELDAELRFHFERQVEKHVNSGLTKAEAMRRTRLEFGGVESVKEECRATRGVMLVETALQDVRYAIRGFRQTPGLALTVIVTIALGLGLNTTVFTIFNAYVLRPLSVRDPYSLYRFTWRNKSGDDHLFTWREFEDFQHENPVFSEIVAQDHLSFVRGERHTLIGYLVTDNYFQMLDINAAFGRTLLPGDSSVPGGSPVMVLSYSAWKNKFTRIPRSWEKSCLSTVIHLRSWAWLERDSMG